MLYPLSYEGAGGRVTAARRRPLITSEDRFIGAGLTLSDSPIFVCYLGPAKGGIKLPGAKPHMS